jgi:hypothetical protein
MENDGSAYKQSGLFSTIKFYIPEFEKKIKNVAHVRSSEHGMCLLSFRPCFSGSYTFSAHQMRGMYNKGENL